MIYGIGLKGPEPSWDAVPGRTVLQDPTALYQAGVLGRAAEIPEDASYSRAGRDRRRPVRRTRAGSAGAGGGAAASARRRRRPASSSRRPAPSLPASTAPSNVFDIGGDRWPKINESLDFLAFFHDAALRRSSRSPRSSRLAPSRAGRRAAPSIDETRQRQYVYMVRNLGARRQPATVLFDRRRRSSSSTLCWLLHRRDGRPSAATAAPATARTTAESTEWRHAMEPVPARSSCCWLVLAIVFGGASASCWPRACSPRAGRRRPRRRRTSAASCRAASRRSASRSASTSWRCCSSCSTSRSSSCTRTPSPAATLGVYGFVAIVDLLGAVLPDVRLRGRPRRPRLGPAAAYRATSRADAAAGQPGAHVDDHRSGASAPDGRAPERSGVGGTDGPRQRRPRRRPRGVHPQRHHRQASRSSSSGPGRAARGRRTSGWPAAPSR